MTDWVNGTIVAVERWTDTLFSLKLKASISPFNAGQFIKLGLGINGKFVQRAYSFVNSPDNNLLEFYLVNVKNGALSPYLHRLTSGDSIQITQQAAGFFTLSELPECKTLWMIATGTAIGPYLSILQYGKDLEQFEHIVLVHAVRYGADLSYLPLMKTLVQSYAGRLSIQTVVSREIVSRDIVSRELVNREMVASSLHNSLYSSLHGRIPDLLKSGVLEQSVGRFISTETSHVMLCGNPSMIIDTREYLKEQRNMNKHLRRKPGHITSELYW